MKKNAMLKIAAILMVAVLLTTCAISSTFAKYTTSDDGSATARVARFGVKLDVALEENPLFASSYAGGEPKADGINQDELSVVANPNGATYTTTNLVAPGTGKQITGAVKISGKPEVDVRVTYTANILLTGWTIEAGEYMPLKFTIGNTPYTFDAATHSTIAEWCDEVLEPAFAAYSNYYDAGATVNDTLDANINFGWEWEFTTGTDNDKKDTELGNLGISYDGEGNQVIDPGKAPTVSVELIVTVDQVD